MTRNSKHMMEEADIGSGEKSPAERETQEMIEQIPPHSDNHKPSQTSVKDEQPSRRDTR